MLRKLSSYTRSRSQINVTDKIASTAKRLNVRYMVFDILHFNGQNLRRLPLLQRKEMLNEVLPDSTAIHKIQFLEKEGIAFFEAIKQQNLEGIVCKRKDSVYVGKRSSDWIKVINYQYVDVFISGYRKGKFGWLASVMGTNGCLRSVEIIDEKSGVSPVHKKAFRGVCDQLVIGEDKNFVYLETRMRAKVNSGTGLITVCFERRCSLTLFFIKLVSPLIAGFSYIFNLRASEKALLTGITYLHYGNC
ncbi:hypothetical protein ACFVS2_05390 [Brevibacillus sp. NPDC058079]|uniref:ATP-dependent DNA ligase n=1 Tax=Brevibacillus sp. NPDC058079 TaxID=3346330 RepID=UPI0036E376D7